MTGNPPLRSGDTPGSSVRDALPNRVAYEGRSNHGGRAEHEEAVLTKLDVSWTVRGKRRNPAQLRRLNRSPTHGTAPWVTRYVAAQSELESGRGALCRSIRSSMRTGLRAGSADVSIQRAQHVALGQDQPFVALPEYLLACAGHQQGPVQPVDTSPRYKSRAETSPHANARSTRRMRF